MTSYMIPATGRPARVITDGIGSNETGWRNSPVARYQVSSSTCARTTAGSHTCTSTPGTWGRISAASAAFDASAVTGVPTSAKPWRMPVV